MSVASILNEKEKRPNSEKYSLRSFVMTVAAHLSSS